jgi:serine phosphatase RsbU (regulator of sigma subunit)
VPLHGELANVVARPRSMRLLREHARMCHCEVGVFAADGSPLAAQGALAHAKPSGVNGRQRVEGVPAPVAVSAVIAFDRVLGYVVARADPQDRRADEPQGVAEHGAAILSELAAREYELNDLSREILGSYEELNLFYDLAGELAGARDAEAMCRLVLAKARRVVPAKKAWVLLCDGERALRVAAGDGSGVVEGGRAAALVARGAAEIVDDIPQSDPTTLSPLERSAERSLLTTALAPPGRDDRPAVGVLQMADKIGVDGEVTSFTAADLKLAQAIASQAAALIQNSRLIGLERELRIARTIQESLLPGDPPAVPHLEVAGRCVPASNVGGDYYDHLATGAGSLVFMVADVSGHNLAAALLQTAARAAFRAAVHAESSPAQVMRHASRTLHDDLTRAELFLTAWLGRFDPATGVLAFSDAGHNPAILLRAATGAIEHLATSGIPVGVHEDSVFDEIEVRLAPGDTVLVYTDGITETSPAGDDSVQYGEERLAAVLKRVAGQSAASVVRAVLEDVVRFSGGRPAVDDRSLVVLRYVG